MKILLKTILLILFLMYITINIQSSFNYHYDCPQGYTYVIVYENELRWIYVYCGDYLIERYIDDDYIPEP